MGVQDITDRVSCTKITQHRLNSYPSPMDDSPTSTHFGVQLNALVHISTLTPRVHLSSPAMGTHPPEKLRELRSPSTEIVVIVSVESHELSPRQMRIRAEFYRSGSAISGLTFHLSPFHLGWPNRFFAFALTGFLPQLSFNSIPLSTLDTRRSSLDISTLNRSPWLSTFILLFSPSLSSY